MKNIQDLNDLEILSVLMKDDDYWELVDAQERSRLPMDAFLMKMLDVYNDPMWLE